jgi:hypothetical protein
VCGCGVTTPDLHYAIGLRRTFTQLQSRSHKHRFTQAHSHKQHNLSQYTSTFTHVDSHKHIHTSTYVRTPAARTERARPSSCSGLVYARLWALRGCSWFNSCMLYLALSPAKYRNRCSPMPLSAMLLRASTRPCRAFRGGHCSFGAPILVLPHPKTEFVCKRNGDRSC